MTATATVQQVPVSAIVPRAGQPRQAFDTEGLRELVASVRANGIITPLTVRPVPGNGHFDLLAGHRRLRAALEAGLTEVPCYVREGLSDDEAEEVVLWDNLARVDLLPWEEGAGYQSLLGRMTLAEVERRSGKRRAHIEGRLSVVGAGEAARRAYQRGDIGLDMLRRIAALPDRNLAPVQCQCGRIVPDGVERCPACNEEPECGIFGRVEVGNPQTVAVEACAGRTPDAAEAALRYVRQAFGLEPVQQTLCAQVRLVSPEALGARDRLRTALTRFGRDLGRAAKGEQLRELTAGDREDLKRRLEATEQECRRLREGL